MFPVVCHKTMAMAQNELKITNGTMRLFRLNAFFFIGFILSFFIFITLFMSQIKPVADIVLAPESQPQQILTKVWEIFHFSQYITWSLLYGFVNIRLNCNLNKIVKRSRMAKQNSDFFQELEHVKIPWGERSIWVPLFYSCAQREVEGTPAFCPDASLSYHIKIRDCFHFRYGISRN